MCHRCWTRHPDRPRTRVANLIAALGEPPEWLAEFAEFAVDRHCVERTCMMLTALGHLLADAEPSHPQALLDRSRLSGRSPGALARTLEEFFVARHLAFGLDEGPRLARGRRHRRIASVPESLRRLVSDFAEHLVRSQERARRAGTRPRSDTTIEATLALVRDFSVFLAEQRQKTDWSAVEVGDVEAFLNCQPANRSRRIGALRQFFRFARKHAHVLVDPTRTLLPVRRSGFKGRVLEADEQRRLFRRFTALDANVHPHEALVGILALLHAASSAELRGLSVDDVDERRRTIRLGRRPHPVPLDPVTADVLHRALLHRGALGTKNPHVIVTNVTKTRNTPASEAYLAHVLDAAAVVPKVLRQTRIIALVTTLDPKVAAEALGMNADGLVSYIADDVDLSRLPDRARSSNV